MAVEIGLDYSDEDYDLPDDFDRGPTLQDQLHEEKELTKQLTEALVNSLKENLKIMQQLFVERNQFNLLALELRKVRVEVMDWKTIVKVLVAEIKVMDLRVPAQEDKEPVSTTIKPEREVTLSDWEVNDDVKFDIPDSISIHDSSTMDNVEVFEDSNWPETDAPSNAGAMSIDDAHSKPDAVKTSAPKKKVRIRRETPGAIDNFVKSTNGYQCKICLKYLGAKAYLSAHLRYHKQSHIRYPCQLCDKVFRNKYQMKTHVKHIHLNMPRERPTCDLCGKSFTSAQNLRRHLATAHTNNRPFLCDICGKGFKVQSVLNLHAKQHEKPTNYKCRVCDLTLTDKVEMAEHRKIHPRKQVTKCHVCEREFYTRPVLLEHLKTHTELTRFPCDQCDKTFLKKSSLRAHKDGHSSELRFACEFCGKRFRRRFSHYAHKLTHTETKPTKKCEICGLMFKTKNYFRHRKTHQRKCGTCGAEFKLQSELQQHYYVHTGIPPFKCPVCSVQFIDRTLYWKHKLSHDELKPFVCPRCGRRFVTPTHLATHIKTHERLGTDVINPRGNKASTTFVPKRTSSATIVPKRTPSASPSVSGKWKSVGGRRIQTFLVDSVLEEGVFHRTSLPVLD